MRLGVVVPTFNRKRKTKRFLECFAHQTRKDFQLYMVDSGSTDGTREMLAAHPHCRLLRATSRQWWAGAMNLGVKQAFRDGCDVILSINDDAVVKPDYVASFVALFEKYDCQILSNRIDYLDDPGRIWSLGSYTLWNTPLLFKLRFCGVRMGDLPFELASQDIAPTMTACGDGMLVRKNVYDRIGLYAARGVKFLHGDSEFTLRAQKAGIPVHVAPHIVLYNDVYNDDVNPLDRLPDGPLLRAAFAHFFSVRSYAYLRTVFFIIARHCPWGAKLKTAIKFVLFELFVLNATRRPAASAETAPEAKEQAAAQKAPKFLMRILRAVVNPDVAVNLDGAHLEGDMREINDLRRIRAKAGRMASRQRKMGKAPQAYGE